MAENRNAVSKAKKRVVPVNKNMVPCEFIKDFDGGRIKKGFKKIFSASTAADFYVNGYVKISDEGKKMIPETIKFVDEHKKAVQSLRDEEKYN